MSDRKPFLVPLDTVLDDPAMQAGSRGARKWVVTERWPAMEMEPDTTRVLPSHLTPRCPVLQLPDTEVAVFNQHVPQDRHYHKHATEFYMPIKGQLSIEVEGEIHVLNPGDMIAVPPLASHLVSQEGEFLCRVMSVHCGGELDKYPSDE